MKIHITIHITIGIIRPKQLKSYTYPTKLSNDLLHYLVAEQWVTEIYIFIYIFPISNPIWINLAFHQKVLRRYFWHWVYILRTCLVYKFKKWKSNLTKNEMSWRFFKIMCQRKLAKFSNIQGMRRSKFEVFFSHYYVRERQRFTPRFCIINENKLFHTFQFHIK